MSPEQVAELLVGIAEAQAAVFAAITATYEKGVVVSQAKQVADQLLYSLQGGQNKKPITLETLPAKVFQAALSPTSNAGKNIRQNTIAELERLLQHQA